MLHTRQPCGGLPEGGFFNSPRDGIVFAVPSSFAPIAQLVEQLPLKEMVPGSNPGGRTTSLL
jgi:hypothetical protein